MGVGQVTREQHTGSEDGSADEWSKTRRKLRVGESLFGHLETKIE